MIELEDARSRILAATGLLPVERVPLEQAHGRCLAQEIVPALNLPPFDNSAMDGWAVRAADLANARADAPVKLRVCGRIAAGESWPQMPPVQPGSCVRVFTGSPLPAGADAVVMQEDTRPDSSEPESVLILEAPKPWENVRLQGEDVKAGRRILPVGTRLSAGRIGLLAALGVKEVEVRRKPVVAFLSTGDELCEGGTALTPGKIYESNRALLAALAGGSACALPAADIVPDAPEPIRRALAKSFGAADVVITSGGVSVGEKDFVKQSLVELGGAVDFWKVAIKPGKPFVYGRWNGKHFFGLPGNPVSASVTFLLLVRPALWASQGAIDLAPEAGSCILGEALTNRGDRRQFFRVKVNSQGEATSAGPQASHMMSSLAEANGLVEVPPGGRLEKGSVAPVLRFGE